MHANPPPPPPHFAVCNWLFPSRSSADDALSSVRRILDDAKLLHLDYAATFAAQEAATFVWTSNKHEGTLPKGSSVSDTYAALKNAVAGHTALPVASWFIDGGNSGDAARSQLTQHAVALKFLMSAGAAGSALSVELLLEAHGLLMHGAIRHGLLHPFPMGLRAHDAYTTGHTYPEGNPVALRQALNRAVDSYNESFATGGTVALIEAPARLFYDVITIHPFSDGNGRLCRLLAAFALRRAGVPFAVPLSSRHSKPRSHYMHAINAMRRGANMAELHALFLMSTLAVLRNYEENVRVMGYGAAPVA